MNHDEGCTGGHTEHISCAEVAELRAEVEANPKYCHGLTTSGYHKFSSNPNIADDEGCLNFGCYWTWGQLKEML